ncbi:MAG: GNAT family N-acetyltransferase [Sarcina sp.]
MDYNLKFRKSKIEDIAEIMEIIKEAKKSLKSDNIKQWQDGYPNDDTIYKDIQNQESYVMTSSNDEILATAMVSFGGEPTYDEISLGEWVTNEEFCVIHRIAIKEEFKGKRLARFMFKFIEELAKEKNVKSIKIDTHKDNSSMIRCLSKNEFMYCGIIYVCDGSQRVAFEKVLG